MIIVATLIVFFTLLLFYFTFRAYQINTEGSEMDAPLLE